MRAAVITSLTGPCDITVKDVSPPPRGPGEILVAVTWAGLSFPEVLLSRGTYQLRPDVPFVPGSEVAGVVVEADASSGLAPGDRVAAWCRVGGLAELVSVPAWAVLPLPSEIADDVACGVLLNHGTAYFGLVRRGRLVAGEAVLVHGAAGGVGTAAIQVAKAFGAGRVVAVTSTAAKGDIALSSGADEVVLTADFAGQARSLAVDIVLDPVGGDRFTDSLRSLQTGGRLLVVGFVGGSIPEVKVNRLLLNNIDVVGVGWGAYVRQDPSELTDQWAAMLPHLTSGALRPTLQHRSMDEVPEALAAIEDRGVVGKIVVEVGSSDA